MSKVFVSQFEDKDGTVKDRVLDVSDIDRELSRIRRVMVKGIDAINLATGLKFAVGTGVTGDFESAINEKYHFPVLSGFKLTEPTTNGVTEIGSVPTGAVWTAVDCRGVLVRATTGAPATISVLIKYGTTTLITATAAKDANVSAGTGLTGYSFSWSGSESVAAGSGLYAVSADLNLTSASYVLTFRAEHIS